jgi:hypothetical protein
MRFVTMTRGVPGRLAIAAAVILVACIPAWADAQEQAAAGVPAVWTPKELRFTFMGFTSRYSCDGLRDKIRTVLAKLGARKDMEVRESACADLGRPTQFPGVTIKIHVLQPASGPGGAADAQTVPAHWRAVDLAADRDLVKAAGDCELVEQIKQSILPMFTTRNLEYHSTCVPNQLSIGGTTLKAEVLLVDQSAGKSAEAR